jgi:hypothetical protein
VYIAAPRTKSAPSKLPANAGSDDSARAALRLAIRRWQMEAAKEALSSKDLLGRAANSAGGDLYRDLGDLFAVRCGPEAFDRAWNRLRRTGLQVSWHTLFDLAVEFSSGALPKAMKSFDVMRGVGRETEWLTTVFYHFALRSVISDRINKIQLAEFESVERSTPEWELDLADQQRVETSLPEALNSMSEDRRVCLLGYFGIDGKEKTFTEIGAAIGISEYRARNLVIASLIEIAARLGVQGVLEDGVLEDTEYRYARLLFIDGMEPEAAGRHVRVQHTEMSRRLAKKFRNVLRQRTVRHHISIAENQET